MRRHPATSIKSGGRSVTERRTLRHPLGSTDPGSRGGRGLSESSTFVGLDDELMTARQVFPLIAPFSPMNFVNSCFVGALIVVRFNGELEAMTEHQFLVPVAVNPGVFGSQVRGPSADTLRGSE